VCILDNLFRGRPANIAHHRDKPAVQFCQGDIRDYEVVREAARDAELIFHLAAQSNVMGAVADVDYSFTTNVSGTFNVLKAARECGARRVVFTSSREAYGEARYLPVDEDHPLDGKNTYAASKIAGEMYCRVFASNFGLETAVLRLANVYGARDYGRVIPLWLERARRDENLVVYGGQQLIDFVWIEVVVEALLRASQAELVGRPVNVGSGQGTPILDLAARILALVPSASRLDVQPARGVEVARFVARVDRMCELLGLERPLDPLFGLTQLATAHP
jgi:nucleoside-diphosphate-sugar epimerase